MSDEGYINVSLLDSPSPAVSDRDAEGDSDDAASSGDDYQGTSGSDDSASEVADALGADEEAKWQAVLETANVPETVAGSSRGPGFCSMCEKSFNEARNIKAHMESVHTAVRCKYACILCLYNFGIRKSFFHSKDARRHLRSKMHLNDKNAQIEKDMLMKVSQDWDKQ